MFLSCKLQKLIPAKHCVYWDVVDKENFLSAGCLQNFPAPLAPKLQHVMVRTYVSRRPKGGGGGDGVGN